METFCAKIWSLSVLQIEQMVNASFSPSPSHSAPSKAASPGMAGHPLLAKNQVLYSGSSGCD